MRRFIFVLVPLLSAACALPMTQRGASDAVRLNVASELPATEGEVVVGETKNGNTSINLQVRHLAPPERLTPAAGVYVVWTRPNREARPQNIGALKPDNQLRATLDTVTPFESFELFVTGESSPQAIDPSGHPLLWATVANQ